MRHTKGILVALALGAFASLGESHAQGTGPVQTPTTHGPATEVTRDTDDFPHECYRFGFDCMPPGDRMQPMCHNGYVQWANAHCPGGSHVTY